MPATSLPKVVEYEIHRRTTPDTFTKAGLQRLLALEDRLAITRLAALQPAARESLFELDSGALVRLARNLDETQLDSLSRYLTGWRKAPAQRILSAVAQAPARMADLASPRVRDAIIASRDQAAAVAMMLQVASVPDPGAVDRPHQACARRPRQPGAAVGEARHRAGGGGGAGADAAADPEAAAVRHASESCRAARVRSPEPRLMHLVTSETVDRPIERGEIVYAVAVSGANILRDMREAVVNTLGGHMTKYEALLDKTIARALDGLSERARAKGYDGVLGIRVTHPYITNGAIEVVVTGTGFKYARE